MTATVKEKADAKVSAKASVKASVKAAPPSEKPARETAVRNPERTRASILAAATKEFTEKGYGGARINAIAARARINKRMLYHYFGGKEALYLAVLESAYIGIRSAESELHLGDRPPIEAMRQLALFTWNYFLEHPEFLSLLGTENLLKAKHLKQSKTIIALHSRLIHLISDTLERGAAAGDFREGVDPVDTYIGIAALGFFYLSNRWTLSTIFNRDLIAPEALAHWGEHIVEMTIASLRPAG